MKNNVALLLALMVPAFCFGAVLDVLPPHGIQSAVNSAGSGDTILIHDGEYVETTVLYGKTLTIGSAFLIDGDTSHITQTRITSDGLRVDTGSCFVYAYGESDQSRLTGLTVSGRFGGTKCVNQPDALFAGGAVAIFASSVALDHCVIDSSEDGSRGGYGYGGGIGIFGTRNTRDSRVEITNCRIAHNFSTTWGGGLYTSYCTLRVQGCEFGGNQCGYGGAAAVILDCTTLFDSCWIHASYGPSEAAVFGGCDTLIVSRCLFEDNAVSDPWNPTCLGVADSRCLITGNVFHNNRGESPVGIIEDYYWVPSLFIGNLIENNTSTTCSGTFALNIGCVEASYNLIRGNVNSLGGAFVAIGRSSPHIHHNCFVGNVSLQPGYGSAISMEDMESALIDSNLFDGNSDAAVGFFYPDHDHWVIHAENNWWGSATGPYHATQNPSGRGDSVYADSILVTPFLTEPPDTSVPESTEPERRAEIGSTWALVAVYPNPFNSSIRIDLAGFAGKDFDLSLYNVLGQQIAVIHRGAMIGNSLHFQAPPSLASGVYILDARDRKHVESRKIVFMK